jgi:tripartite-type tricarboxylate transporter receptor subunit TctC
MMHTMRLLRKALGLASIVVLSLGAAASEVAAQPVRVVLPFGPGSGTDTIARALFDVMGRDLQETFVIENKPGASGSIAAETVARAPADGKSQMRTVRSEPAPLTCDPSVENATP